MLRKKEKEMKKRKGKTKTYTAFFSQLTFLPVFFHIQAVQLMSVTFLPFCLLNTICGLRNLAHYFQIQKSFRLGRQGTRKTETLVFFFFCCFFFPPFNLNSQENIDITNSFLGAEGGKNAFVDVHNTESRIFVSFWATDVFWPDTGSWNITWNIPRECYNKNAILSWWWVTTHSRVKFKMTFWCLHPKETYCRKQILERGEWWHAQLCVVKCLSSMTKQHREAKSAKRGLASWCQGWVTTFYGVCLHTRQNLLEETSWWQGWQHFWGLSGHGRILCVPFWCLKLKKNLFRMTEHTHNMSGLKPKQNPQQWGESYFQMTEKTIVGDRQTRPKVWPGTKQNLLGESLWYRSWDTDNISGVCLNLGEFWSQETLASFPGGLSKPKAEWTWENPAFRRQWQHFVGTNPEQNLHWWILAVADPSNGEEGEVDFLSTVAAEGNPVATLVVAVLANPRIQAPHVEQLPLGQPRVQGHHPGTKKGKHVIMTSP